MADADFVADSVKPLEQILKTRFGADGPGLGALVKSVETKLPRCLIKSLMGIARLRNRVIHDRINLPSRATFQRQCADAHYDLDLISALMTVPQSPTPPRKKASTALKRSTASAVLELEDGEEIQVDGAGATIGRGVGIDDYALESDGLISRKHCHIEHVPNRGFIINDLGSKNGTYVNGEKIPAGRFLESEDEIRIGKTMMIFFEQ